MSVNLWFCIKQAVYVFRRRDFLVYILASYRKSSTTLVGYGFIELEGMDEFPKNFHTGLLSTFNNGVPVKPINIASGRIYASPCSSRRI